MTTKEKTIKIFSDNPLIKNPKQPFANTYQPELKNLADNLTPLLEYEAKEKPLVISIDAPWGVGKTTFIDMWGQSLLNSGKLAIKFDAWKADYSDDPLLTLISTVATTLDEFNNANQVTQIAKQLCQASVSVYKFVGQALLEVAGIKEATEKYIKDLSGAYVGGLFNSYAERTNLLKNFKRAIVTLIEKHKSTLFVFIDELDRCKPTFALQLLEIVKHIFDVEKACFVLAMNSEAMESSIKKIYGQNFDGLGYLERFIDIPIYLPEPDYENFINYELNNINLPLPIAIETIQETVVRFVNNFKLVPRVMSKYLRDIKLFLVQNYQALENEKLPNEYLPAIIFLLGLKRKWLIVYREIMLNGMSILDINKSTFININENTHLLSKEESIKLRNMMCAEKTKLAWTIRFLLASKNKVNLNTTANYLINQINSLERLVAKDSSQMSHFRLPHEIKNEFIDKLYGGLVRPIPHVFSHEPDPQHLKLTTDHFNLAENRLNFLDNFNKSDEKIDQKEYDHSTSLMTEIEN